MKTLQRLFIGSACLFFSLFTLNSFADSSTVGAAVSDTTITAKVKTKLAANRVTKATSINVETNDGIVKLTGTVNSDTEASTAVQIAESTNGVRDVNTADLNVKGSEHPLQDSYLTAKVKGAFIREKIMNDTNLPTTSISVETQDGVVYLSGKVNAQAQAQRAIDIAKSINGVSNVVSNIKIAKGKKV